MSKVKLSKEELAALDVLIASLENDNAISSSPDSLAFPAAVFRVTKVVTRATPAVVNIVTATIGGDRAASEEFNALTDSSGELSLDTLIKLREEATK